MIIVDQEGTLINSERVSAIGKVQDNTGWEIVAFAEFGGAAISLGHYFSENVANAARDRLAMAFSMKQNVFNMPETDIPIEVVQGDGIS